MTAIGKKKIALTPFLNGSSSSKMIHMQINCVKMGTFMLHVTYQMSVPFSHASTAQNIMRLYLQDKGLALGDCSNFIAPSFFFFSIKGIY